jgi:Skp family chaperone for outer membrane proteins
MIRTIAIAAVALSACSARPAYYYQPQKAAADCTEGKKNAADEKADGEAKQVQAREAKAKNQPDADLIAQRLGQQWQQVHDGNLKKLAERMDRIARQLRADRGLQAVLPTFPGAAVAPEFDLTSEVQRRLDAGDGAAEDDLRQAVAETTAERDRLRAQVAALQASKTAAKPARP